MAKEIRIRVALNDQSDDRCPYCGDTKDPRPETHIAEGRCVCCSDKGGSFCRDTTGLDHCTNGWEVAS